MVCFGSIDNGVLGDEQGGSDGDADGEKRAEEFAGENDEDQRNDGDKVEQAADP